ncbi:MAG: 30S ribosomal protein S20 [Candidatus Aminicenantales bacterium]|nr:30S ribosomal protein S20 [Candidatus Saccharicenans sp.]
MALRHKSAIKQHRQSLKHQAINQRNKSLMKTYVKKVREAIASGDHQAAIELLPKAIKAIDQTVAKGAIHQNTGSRYKSRLSKQVMGLKSQAS